MVLTGIAFFACDKENDDANDDNTSPCQSDFDQKAMFGNIADNLIIPAYQNLETALETLENNFNQFTQTTDLSNLATLQSSFIDAYKAWQAAEVFEFGPAETAFLRNSLNNFPVNVGQVENNLANSSIDFEDIYGFDKGFPALDYFFFGIGETPDSIVTTFEAASSIVMSTHSSIMIEEMHKKVNTVLTAWNDGYRETFVNNTGTADGSSLSLLINALNEHYEIIKRDRIGIPAGVTTLNIPNNDKVEAFYSGTSLDLAIESLKANENVYLGGNGLGLDDYLRHINAQSSTQESLDQLIQTQYTMGLDELESLSGRLSDLVGTSQTSPEIQAAYDAVNEQIVYLKTDMPSNLCVSITYIDNPSDSD